MWTEFSKGSWCRKGWGPTPQAPTWLAIPRAYRSVYSRIYWLFHFILCSIYKNKKCKQIKAFICSTHRFLRHLGPGNSPQQHHVHCYSQHRCHKGTGRQHQQHKQDSKTIFYLNSILHILKNYGYLQYDMQRPQMYFQDHFYVYIVLEILKIRKIIYIFTIAFLKIW